MKNSLLKLVLVLGSATALSACSTSIRDNPCLIWLADNGPYIVKYTAKNPADTCGVAGALDGQFSTVSAQLYPQPGTTTLALLPYEVVEADADGFRPDTVKIATGVFDNEGQAVDDACTVPTLTESSNSDGSTKFQFSNVSFIEDASTQGMAMQGDVTITAGGCSSDFTFEALGWAYFTECASGADCIPIPDPSAGRFVGAPYSPTIQTKCDKSPEVVNSLTGDPDLGVCFFANPYPSLCPEGSLAGDANCPIN